MELGLYLKEAIQEGSMYAKLGQVVSLRDDFVVDFTKVSQFSVALDTSFINIFNQVRLTN